MISKKEFYIKSTNKINNLHLIMWKPACPVKGIVQISHGMIEHIDRYDDFARFLAKKGYFVVGNDHLAHGKTVCYENELGFFNAKDPGRTVVDDLHKITLLVKESYPDTPYFLLGHSMGSFMARRYLITYGKELDGAIILGTGMHSKAALSLGDSLIKLISHFKPMTYRSPLVEKFCFGLYNIRIKDHVTDKDWLSRDPQVVEDYISDPLCRFNFSLNGYQTLFNTLSFIQVPEHIARVPKSLPILMAAGDKDPVGNYGRGVRKVYKAYQNAGIQDLQLRLYQGDRHEILNEIDKKGVYADIYGWLETHLGCKGN